MSPVSVVTDSTSYLPPDLSSGTASPSCRCTSCSAATARSPRSTSPTTRRSSRSCARRRSCRPPRSPRSATSPPSYEPLLADGGEVVSVHISGGLSGTPEAARQAKEALTRDGRGGERIEVVDSTTAAGGLGFMVLAAAKAARDGASAKEVAEHVAAGAQGAAALVRHRHARVPQARRAHRRRQRVDRIHAEGEADPHRRERDDAGRARAHVLARVRAAASTTRARAPTRAPTRGRRSTSTRPTSARGSWSAAPRSTGTGRRS